MHHELSGKGQCSNMTFFSRLLYFFDLLVEPVVAFPQNPYANQLRTYVAYLRAGRSPLRVLLLFFRVVLHLTAGILVTPVSALFQLLGFRFLSIDLTQVGSIFFLDMFLRENRLGQCTPRHKLFICRSAYLDANAYALDLYGPYVTFVKNPFLKLALSPFFMNPFFRENTFRFDPSINYRESVAEQRTIAHQIWQGHDDRFGIPLATLDDAAVARGREMIAHVLPAGRKFVALHVRDSGFYGSARMVTRNADITTYEPAIRYLIDLGYIVVRMGDAKMVGIDDMIVRCGPGLIDYAHSDLKSDFLDCYLCSQCVFFIGLASGLLDLPRVLGRALCIINYYNATVCLGFSESDLSTFKKFRYISDDSLVPFNRILRPPFSQNPQLSGLMAAGAYLEDNSEDEILATVKEFVERDGVDPTPIQKAAKDMIVEGHYCYGARGHFSNTFLTGYFPDEDAPDNTR